METIPARSSLRSCTGETTPSLYKPRQPKRSPLYRVLEEHFDRFRVMYEFQFEREDDPLRAVVAKAVKEFLECGIIGKERITESVDQNMLPWPHSGFHVHLGPGIRKDPRSRGFSSLWHGAVQDVKTMIPRTIKGKAKTCRPISPSSLEKTRHVHG